MLLVSLFLASSAFAQELAPQYKLMDGVRQMVKQGKSLDETKKELKIAGTEDWEGQDRFADNIEAAYRGVMGNESNWKMKPSFPAFAASRQAYSELAHRLS